jgi:hypothetical protein
MGLWRKSPFLQGSIDGSDVVRPTVGSLALYLEIYGSKAPVPCRNDRTT